MKTLFIEARKKKFPELNLEELASQLPKEITLAYSIQYKELAEKLKKKLEAKGKKIDFAGQVLGCSVINVKGKALLLIGSGRFHAVQLALTTEKPVYILDGNKLSKINEEEIEKLKLKRKSAISKFLSAENIGIIVSVKPGQNKMKEAEKLKKKLEDKGKKIFIFLCDNINLQELENFPCQSWINTACPGLFLDDSRIVNIADIKEYI